MKEMGQNVTKFGGNKKPAAGENFLEIVQQNCLVKSVQAPPKFWAGPNVPSPPPQILKNLQPPQVGFFKNFQPPPELI